MNKKTDSYGNPQLFQPVQPAKPAGYVQLVQIPGKLNFLLSGVRASGRNGAIPLNVQCIGMCQTGRDPMEFLEILNF